MNRELEGVVLSSLNDQVSSNSEGQSDSMVEEPPAQGQSSESQADNHHSDDEDVSSFLSESESTIDESTMIAKPPGSAGRPNTYGYTLKTELQKRGWTVKNIQEVVVCRLLSLFRPPT